MIELRETYPYVRVTALNKFMPPKDRIYPLVKAYTLGAKLWYVTRQTFLVPCVGSAGDFLMS